MSKAEVGGTPESASPKAGWFARLKSGVAKTSRQLISGVSSALSSGVIDQDNLDYIEESLLSADFGFELTNDVVTELKRARLGKEVTTQELLNKVQQLVQARLEPVTGQLISADEILKQTITDSGEHSPYVMFFSGVNGAGKTTSIGKLALHYTKLNLKVLIVAADTFRAAAAEQLAIWADRASVDIYRGKDSSDPSGLVWEAIQHAKQNRYDLVIIDTAGRLHNRVELMDQLSKIWRSVTKSLGTDAHQHILIVDGSAGQSALQQVSQFSAVVPVTSIIITKLDNTPKAGIVVAIGSRFDIPIVSVGVGERLEDLQPFVAAEFARAIVGGD